MCNRELVTALKKTDDQIDPEIVKVFTKSLVESFIKHVKKESSLRGETKDGQEVTIYSTQTLLRYIAEKSLPEFPGRGVILSVLTNQIVENALSNKLSDLVASCILSSDLLTSKESIGGALKKAPLISLAVGAKAAQGFKEYWEQEVPFYQLSLEEQTDPLWEYLEPRVRHYVRSFMLDAISSARNTILENVDKKARQTFNGIVATGGCHLVCVSSRLKFHPTFKKQSKLV